MLSFKEICKIALLWANDGRFPWHDFTIQTSEFEYSRGDGWLMLSSISDERFSEITLHVRIPEDDVTAFQLDII